MAFEQGRLRADVLGYLRTYPSGRVSLAFDGPSSLLNYFKHSKGIEFDHAAQDAILRVFHDLYHERVIDSGTGPGYDRCLMEWPYYHVTDYGRRVLESTDYTPHDPDGYLAKLRRDVPVIPADAIRYLEESLGCLRSSYLLAASVTLGCAAEKCLLELVEAFGGSISDPAKKADYEKDTKTWVISKKYEALWKRLEPMAATFPKPLRDDLHTILDRVFDLIRTTRNEAGHPTGKVIEREAVHANLMLFPSFCRRIYGLIEHFARTEG